MGVLIVKWSSQVVSHLVMCHSQVAHMVVCKCHYQVAHLVGWVSCELLRQCVVLMIIWILHELHELHDLMVSCQLFSGRKYLWDTCVHIRFFSLVCHSMCVCSQWHRSLVRQVLVQYNITSLQKLEKRLILYQLYTIEMATSLYNNIFHHKFRQDASCWAMMVELPVTVIRGVWPKCGTKWFTSSLHADLNHGSSHYKWDALPLRHTGCHFLLNLPYSKTKIANSKGHISHKKIQQVCLPKS